MAFTVYPTQNDVGVAPGDGNLASEGNVSAFMRKFMPYVTQKFDAITMGSGSIIGGFEVGATAANTVDLLLGFALVEGYFVNSGSTIQLATTNNVFNHVWVQLTKSAGLVTGAQLVVTTSTAWDNFTALADAQLIWSFEVNGIGTIINQYNWKHSSPGFTVGKYTGNEGVQNIDLGRRPKLVMIWQPNATLTTPRTLSISGLGIPEIDWLNYGMVIQDVAGAIPFVGDNRMLGMRITASNSEVAFMLENGFNVDGLDVFCPFTWVRKSEGAKHSYRRRL